ncbi:nucleotide sugar dehydrogenase [Actinomadura sediminis]|uniref:Nucleotide sugar dehydrogenase n=1 Tax=Actinomadura sediminis TaxID=1038904 RepID=A0ABW3EY69_9ACTN
MRFLPDSAELNAVVLGMGYVGSCVAAALADRGVRVTGVDVDPGLVAELAGRYCRYSEAGLAGLLNSGLDAGTLRVGTDYAAVRDADVVIVAVGTPIRDAGELDDSQLAGACRELSRWLRPGQLLIFKSTVPPGRTRELVVPILESGGLACGTDFGLAFCPERLSEGTALRELAEFPIVVGGWDGDSAAAAAAFWRRTIGVPVIPCASPEAAELVKLADNWWIDHNIALANELAKLCGAFDVDVLDVIEAANSIPKGNGNVNILLPGVGVGGSCLTKDPWMTWRAARARGVELRTIPVAREVNDGMPAHTAGLILDGLADLGRAPDRAVVAIMGLAFKNDTGDLRATPTRDVVDNLRDAGVDVRLYEPLSRPEELERTFGMKARETLDDAVADADCIAVLARHREFDAVDFAALRRLAADPCLLFDGRAHYPRERVRELEDAGYVYRGIGR